MTKALQAAFDEILFIDENGKNKLLAKKATVKSIAYWVATKTAKYGTKFASTETVRDIIVDVLYASLNEKEISFKMDDIEF